MANVKISELTALTPPDAADLVPVTDSSANQTKRTTVGEIVGIVNGDVDVANDGTATISELPVSKLQDGAARQLLQTDAAGTGVEWTSNVDVPGTLGVNGQSTLASAAISDLTSGRVVLAGTSGELEDNAGLTFNSTQLNVPLGIEAAPSLTFIGDPNTGIYSPGDDQVAISTNETRRLIILSDGKVGLGAASVLQQGSGIDGGSAAGILELYNGGTGNTTLENTGAFPILFKTNSTERLRITSAGLVGIGTSAPDATSQLHIVGSSYQPLYVNTTSAGGGGATFFRSGTQALYVGTAGSSWLSGSSTADGLVRAEANLVLATNGNSRAVTIDTSQRVGIGTTSPDAPLHIQTASGSKAEINLAQTATTNYRISVPASTDALTFIYGESTERMRIDSSGRLLVGTSSAPTNVYPTSVAVTPSCVIDGGTNPLALMIDNNSVSGNIVSFARRYAAAADGSISRLLFSQHDGTNYRTAAQIAAEIDGTPGTADMPGRLVFSTTADGASSPTERMRLNSSGQLLVGTSSSVGSRELQLASGFSANANRSSSFAKSLSLSDNVSTTYFTIAIPAFVDFADVLSVGVEVSYVVTAHRQTSGRGATATYGKVYLAISRYWESSTVAPIVTALTTTDQALAFADQGTNPTITWAVSQDAGTDQAAKNVYLSITVDNTASGTIVQRVDGTAAMNYYTTRGVIGIS